MPQDAPISFTVGELEEGYCFTSWQTTLEDFFAAVSGYLPGAYNTFNYGSQTPSSDDRGKPWFRLNSDGSPDRWYVFFDGMWVSPHPIEPEDDEVRIWSGSEADISLKDGGNTNAVTLTDGPFWRRANAYNARTVVGVGTLPDSGTVIAVNDTGGEDEVELDTTELPSHTHQAKHSGAEADGNVANPTGGLLGSAAGTDYTFTSEATGGGLGHNNMPPWIGVYFIVRTARQYYALPG